MTCMVLLVRAAVQPAVVAAAVGNSRRLRLRLHRRELRRPRRATAAARFVGTVLPLAAEDEDEGDVSAEAAALAAAGSQGCDVLPPIAKLKAEEATIRQDAEGLAAMNVASPYAKAMVMAQLEWCDVRLAAIRAELAMLG